MVRRLGLREREILDTFVTNEKKLIELLKNDKDNNQKLKVADLVIFKDRAGDIMGIELESFTQYLIDYSLKSKIIIYVKHCDL